MISERKCTIIIKNRCNNISLVSFYVATEEIYCDEKDYLYAQLEVIISKIPSYDIKLLLGDANTKIGKGLIWSFSGTN